MNQQRSILPDQPPDLSQQIAEIERELKVRLKVYPRWVVSKTITPEVADYRIQCMEATLDSLRELRKING